MASPTRSDIAKMVREKRRRQSWLAAGRATGFSAPTVRKYFIRVIRDVRRIVRRASEPDWQPPTKATLVRRRLERHRALPTAKERRLLSELAWKDAERERRAWERECSRPVVFLDKPDGTSAWTSGFGGRA